tara:strand:- start:413 stop:1180 length:768 start_codon:yes stop_codon:yes gene_type:complete
MVRPFPGTGVVTFNVESWDKVGNGVLTSRSVTYEQISSSSSSNVSSPDNLLSMYFNEGSIKSDASLLIQKISKENYEIRSDTERVSNIYNLSSIDMEINDKVEVQLIIPDNFKDIEHWKFRIIKNGSDDITSFSKNGVVYGKLDELGDIALHYDPSTQFSVPEDIDLVGNYPNPFNPSTRVYYIVDKSNLFVEISILDLLGREVRNLYEGVSDIGYYELIWDGTNDNGYQLGSGIYFINAKIGSEQMYKKIMKLK